VVSLSTPAQSLGFSKQQRLLKPAEYKVVFDGADYKASHPSFLLLAGCNRLGRARLGLVIGKRHVRLAVKRNMIKRVARECFRLRQDRLPDVDFVLLARRGADEFNRAELRRIFNGLCKRIEKRAAKPAPVEPSGC